MVHAAGLRTVVGLQRRVHLRAVTWLTVVALLGGGCTTMKPSQLPPEALRSMIRNGSAFQVGDQVTVFTKDGREHTFTVSTLDTDAIVGKSEGGAQVTVPIDNVVALRTREVDVVRTGFAAVGGSLIVVAAVFSYAMFELFEDLLE